MNFNDKLIPIVGKWIAFFVSMKNLEESRPDFTKNCVNDKKALRGTRIRNIHEMEELRRVKEMRIDEFSIQKLREKSRYNTGAHVTNTGVTGKNGLQE